MRSLLFKITVSAILLYGIFHIINPEELKAVLMQVDWKYIALALFSVFCTIILDTYKFKKLILLFCHAHVPHRRLIRIWMKGFFFSTFLPGGQINMEGTKLVKLAPYLKGAETFSLITADKFLGFLSIGIITSVCLFLDLGASKPLFTGLALLFTLISLLILFTPLTGFLLQLLKSMISGEGRAAHFVKDVSAFFKILEKKKRSMIKLSALSLCCQVLAISALYLSAKSLHIPLSFITAGWIFGIAGVLQFIPVTIAGLGVREGSYIYLMHPYGITGEEAMGVSILVLSLQVIFAAIGGLLVLFVNRSEPYHKAADKGR